MVRPLNRSVLFTLLLFTVLVIGVSDGQKLGKKSTTTTTIAPPPFGNGNVVQKVPSTILNAPSQGCPLGQRKDSKGRCRTIIQ